MTAPVVLSPVDASGRISEKCPGSGIALLLDWPPIPAQTALKVVRKYGRPDEMTPSILVWKEKNQCKRIVVHRDEFFRDDPPHSDHLEHEIALNVPVDKIVDLYKFHHSLVVNRVSGTISSICSSESANMIALNYAKLIANGKMSLERAALSAARDLDNFRRGEKVVFAERIL